MEVENILYIGIDVAKAKLDCAITLDGKMIKARKTIINNQKGFDDLNGWVRKYSSKLNCSDVHYCLEATGVYSEEIVEYLHNSKEKVTISNPAVIKKFGESLNIRTKTDKVDAELIANYVAKMKPENTIKRSAESKKMKQLVRFLNTMTRERANQLVQLESARNDIIKKAINKIIKEYDVQICKIKQELDKIGQSTSSIKNKIDLLKSIPGIGDTTAQILISEFCLENTGNKLSRKAQTAHAGLSPREKQSGSSVRGKSRICRTGDAFLRSSLFMPTMCAIKCNPCIKVFYERLLNAGKSKKVALIACMRKLLCIAIGVLNNGVEFDSAWISQKKCA